MGFLNSLMGNNLAPVAQGANANQATAAYDQTQNGIAQQQAFVNALQNQNGIGNQSNVFNQLQGVANGTGPNPAQAMLNQATGANVANQAALMAGQRGAGANAGMIARQAAQQGAGIQQQAVGQGATMQANQGLNALGQMGNIAGQQVSQQAGALQGFNQAVQGQQANLLGAIGAQNTAGVAAQNSVNSNNIGGKLIGGAAQGAGAAMMAQGGMVPPRSVLGRHLHGAPMMAQGGSVQQGGPEVALKEAVGDKKPIKGEEIAAKGKPVPGKASVKGNSYANDKVPAILSPGEVVIPRSVMQGKDPSGDAAKFVAAILAKQGKKK